MHPSIMSSQFVQRRLDRDRPDARWLPERKLNRETVTSLDLEMEQLPTPAVRKESFVTRLCSFVGLL